jgi:hypothetical protein
MPTSLNLIWILKLISETGIRLMEGNEVKRRKTPS